MNLSNQAVFARLLPPAVLPEIQDCPYFPDFSGAAYDPRCRLWYQDAIQDGNEGVVFTNPYVDADTDELMVTASAPVFNPTCALLGVVAVDMDFQGIEASITELTVTDEEGYAYLLASGGEGEVAAHRNMKKLDDTQYIFDLEKLYGDNEEEKEAFRVLVTSMSDSCEGAEEYEMGGETWILAWKHETNSGAGASESEDCGEGGFIVVVTVSEAALLDVSEALKHPISCSWVCLSAKGGAGPKYRSLLQTGLVHYCCSAASVYDPPFFSSTLRYTCHRLLYRCLNDNTRLSPGRRTRYGTSSPPQVS